VRHRSTLVAGAVALAAGATIVIGTIAIGSFSRADAGEAATDLVRSEMTPQGLARHRADFEIATSATEELYSEAFPAIAAELGLSPDEFEQQVQLRYPAIAEFLSEERRDEAYAFAEGIVANLELHQEDFAQADAIPVSWMPMDLGPWLAIALGGLLAVVGLVTLLRPSPVAVATIALIGLALVVGPLVTRFPQKAVAARDLLDSLTFTEELSAETRDLKEAGDAATEELEQRLVPDVAAALGITAAEFDSIIDARFPAIARASPQFEEIFDRYEARVRIREQGLHVIPVAADYPLASIAWWAVGLGALTAVAAGVALFRSRGS
jgi:hypothetical protein